VLFATASQWVDKLADARTSGRLQAELARLSRYPLLVVDLCRHRDYAEAVGPLGWELGWSRVIWFLMVSA
jgi:hypothetical protein